MESQPINTSFGMRFTLAGVNQRFSSVPQMSTDDLHKLFFSQNAQVENKKLLLLDVRSQDEFKISHIENSLFIDSDKPIQENVMKVNKDIQEILGRRPEGSCLYVVAYCSLGYRSSELINELLSLYQTPSEQVKLYNLEGSIFKWANEGKSLVTDHNQSTKYVHPFNIIWGKLLNSDLRKWI